MDQLNQWLLGLLKSPEIVAVLLTILLTFLYEKINRARLKWAISHQHVFWLRDNRPVAAPPQAEVEGAQERVPQEALVAAREGPNELLIRTRQIWIQNVGRKPVQDIEVVLNYRPHHHEIWPQRDYQTSVNPDNRLVIKVDSLGSREFFTISMIDAGQELPAVMNVRSLDGAAANVNMGPQQIYSPTFIALARVFLWLGVLSAVYLSIRLLQNLAWST